MKHPIVALELVNYCCARCRCPAYVRVRRRGMVDGFSSHEETEYLCLEHLNGELEIPISPFQKPNP